MKFTRKFFTKSSFSILLFLAALVCFPLSTVKLSSNEGNNFLDHTHSTQPDIIEGVVIDDYGCKLAEV